MKYKQIDFTHLLPSVEKPSRYINNEPNSFYNEPVVGKVNFCFAFPDVYEVGFSHLGVKILYSIINNEPDATADRVYAPWSDFGELLKKNRIPLSSFENRVALKEYDVIGFTLQSELTYTNILYILDLAQITMKASERLEDEPLVIAGGPCAAYPEALSPFIDLFFIGEAEEGIIELKNKLREGREKGLSRKELLTSLQSIVGVYVPSLFDRTKRPISPFSTLHPETIKCRKYLNFNEGVSYQNQLISWQQATHDRYVTEIMRGCSRGCRFCFAGYFYRPVREKSVENIVEKLINEVREDGWEDTGLLSLSSSDYSCITPLLIELVSRLQEFDAELSLPSLRADSVDDTIVKLLNTLRQNGITIAPEAGSQRLRDVINKDLTEKHIFDLVELAVKNNWKILKLYFIIGLPFETFEDIEETVSLIQRIANFNRNKLQVNVTLSPFIPKPHTPFQWAEMLPKEELLKRIQYIKNSFFRNKRVKIKYHDVDNSMLECLINRGGEEVGELIYRAYLKGAKFDGWNDFFDYRYWQEAAEELGIDIDEYRLGIDLDAPLLWDHIDLGIDRTYLKNEFNAAKEAVITPDCRTSYCTQCGICDDKLQPSYESFKGESVLQIPPRPQISNKTYAYRVSYAKLGLLRYVSHLDTLRMIHRLLRTTKLPIVYTQGFNRHPKIKYGPPLAVGVEGENEYFDFYLEHPRQVTEIFDALKKKELRNWAWKGVVQLDPNKSSSLADFNEEKVGVEVPQEQIDAIKKQLDRYKKEDHWFYIKKSKGVEKNIDLKQIVSEIELSGDRLTVTKLLSGASIYDILGSVFEIKREDTGFYLIKRIGIAKKGL